MARNHSCRHRRRWNRNQWGNMLFLDESRFCLKKNDGRMRVWRSRENVVHGSAHSQKRHLTVVASWSGGGGGGITSRGKAALVVVDGNLNMLNARRYIAEILQPDHGAKRIAPRRQRPTPRVRIVDAYLQQQRITRIDWPACSP